MEEFLKEMRESISKINNPDEKYFGMGDQHYSPNELLKEIENQTELGKQMFEHWKKLKEEVSEE